MLPLNQRILFGIFAAITIALGARGFYRLALRIRSGRRDTDRRTGNTAERAWYALRTTLTQERVFRRRKVLGVFHSFIFYAFLLYLLVNAVDAVEGFVDFGDLFTSPLGTVYRGLTDLFSVLAIVGVLAFVLRRYTSPGRRELGFNSRTLLHEDVRRGAIKRDSAIVSTFIVVHIGSRILGNAARLAAHGYDPVQPFSNLLAHAFAGHDPMPWRIVGYWGALGSVLLFLPYFPYSKHVHLLMAPLKAFFRRDASTGELPPLKVDLDQAEPALGAATLRELAWPRLLDSYACIQCNRCQDVCPASVTGKALSPAALEINKRMALNAVAREISPFSFAGEARFEKGSVAGANLLDAIISPDAAWACTTCGACMEVCPTENEQMLDIIDIRRNQVLQQGTFPSQLQSAFRGMERAKNPWGIAQEKRMAWAESLHVPTVEEVPVPDVLYWVGCAASYDASAQKTARAVVQLLTEGDVKFAVLGKRETCTGDSARRAGNEVLYQELAGAAIRTLNEVRPKLIIASCPHCVNSIGAEYPQLGGNYTVMHHTEYLASMLDQGRLNVAPSTAKVTFHDPCYLGRHRGTYEQPRSILKALASDVVELDRNRKNAFCCGAGGAQFWKEEEAGSERISENRFHEVQRTLGSSDAEKVLAVGCPFCKSMIQSTPSAGEDESIVIKDVAELLWEGVQRARPAPEPPAELSPPDAVSSKVMRSVPSTAPPPPPQQRPSVQAATSPIPQDAPASDTSDTASVDPALHAAATQDVARKKWAPKRATAVPADALEASPAEPATAPTVARDREEPAAPEANVLRKRWSPKSAAAPSASATEPAGEPAPLQALPVDKVIPSESPSPPARKKWEPRKKD